MNDDYLWDKTGEADPEVARLEKALAPLRHEAAWRGPSEAAPVPKVKEARPIAASSQSKTQRRAAFRGVSIAAGGLAMAAAIALLITRLQPEPHSSGGHASANASASSSGLPPATPSTDSPAVFAGCSSTETAAGESFAFEAKGSVTCGGAPALAGRLPADTWLNTAAGSSANVKVADIGAITLGADSRLRIVGTGAAEHRLELVRGSLHAKVNAPPRLFVIDTRAATAVDLGCEYDLGIDREGRSHLRVTSGAVSLEGKGRAAYVPAGARVTADPDRGPGVVIADGAPQALIDAARRFDAGEAAALRDLLAAAERRDSITLWNLLAGSTRDVREKVVRRMEELSLRPARVKRDALVAGKAKDVDALREHLDETPVAPTPRITW